MFVSWSHFSCSLKKALSSSFLPALVIFVCPAASHATDSSTVYQVNENFRQNANVQDLSLFEEAKKDREFFWSKQAHNLDWFQPWDTVLEWDPPYAKWFLGGKLNASYNCLDRHLNESASKIALLWEGERGEERSISYDQLFNEVCKFSNVLKNLGVKKGDKVAIYLPMIPEAVVAMLSCSRIGAVHTVVFAGFSSDSLKDRIIDAGAKFLITADGSFRKGKIVSLKEMADLALASPTPVEKVVVVKHTEVPVPMNEERDFWYDTLMADAKEECPPESMDAEDELFILYTSGTTGKPKGIVHSTGGYLLGATMSLRWVFDIKPADIYWCTADVGWITGHSYVVYGPLSNGATVLLYEGAPDHPERDRFWRLIEKYGVTILYTAPTAIRTFMKWGEQWVKDHDLSSLRLLGSVGEPINPEAWEWYYTHIGRKNCPVVDTWWQTETGSIMIAPIPALHPLKPGSATKPLPGVDVAIVDEKGDSQTSGFLAITTPWPSMLRGVHNDPVRYQSTYWKKWDKGYYFTGDGASIDNDGYVWLSGRIDDVINVSGHRLGTMELESALVDHKAVAEAAVIAISHEIKGQAIVAFVSVKEDVFNHPGLEDELKQHVVKKIGAIARPERIIFICELPKTRSGKIMRRLLRDVAEGRVIGDTTTLSDPSVIEEIKLKYQED
ncbi:acetate--CoA ligase [Estrella lausannensis]|uniref:Acetyl-coenzyme A synthetase n=1 Tax=Estrella lausannensis TaxID=483423 RepID=A0A0H5DPC5_9BACT|nr:acetate--CoA ligase [Estrella lausannensis]CRX38262.1 Acetyl-coenzyme A synthetase [Estrella lausannensis]